MYLSAKMFLVTFYRVAKCNRQSFVTALHAAYSTLSPQPGNRLQEQVTRTKFQDAHLEPQEQRQLGRSGGGHLEIGL